MKVKLAVGVLGMFVAMAVLVCLSTKEASASSLSSIRQKMVNNDWECSKIYHAGYSDAGFCAVKATDATKGLLRNKKVCTGQGTTESEDLQYVARPCYGYASVTVRSGAIYNEWHTNEATWSFVIETSKSNFISVKAVGSLRDESLKHVLTSYVTDVAD